MVIYRIECDVDNYQYLAQNMEEFEGVAAIVRTRILTRCEPLSEPIVPPEVHSERPKRDRGDFWNFAPYHTFALPPASVEKVRRFLEESGELLPLPFKAEVFSVLNVLNVIDEIEVDKSQLPPRLIFKAPIPAGIFRERNSPYMYVAETSSDPATEFKAFVEKEGMTGLIFCEVWKSES